jgi:hypothetical protein
MTVNEFWFARRFPVGSSRNAVAPVSREGRMVFVYWIAAMVASALAMGFLALRGAYFGGLIVFVVVVVLSTWLLFMAVLRRTDNSRTTEDYHRMPGGQT